MRSNGGYREEERAAESYPLQWPLGRPRRPASERRAGRFSSKGSNSWRRPITISEAIDRLYYELDMLGADGIVISSNLPTRRDGLPRSDAREPSDPAVAVYFRLERKIRCLPSDLFDRVADNIAAVAAHVEAMRGQLRWGVGSVEAAFAGYMALPAMGQKQPWWVLLGFKDKPRDARIVKEKWLALMEKHHPDRGGNANQAAEVNAAYQEAMSEMAVGEYGTDFTDGGR